ncbi:hypothetical protein SKAU_G00259650 [Synaphobranchus kaupii]|uniref:Vitamin K-dependent protein S n=1 Tax=Synaphobranchus kaupii TaxID=118154 RepID=A0A9Q1F4G5_SYNKA|nr:hypothetical protein SKAU_G00259650 [Synaphobranchus kaupii]
MLRKEWSLGELVGCLILLVAVCDAHRFLTQSTASQFLSRRRRANSLFEESKKGNLERECIEELCNKEEAREIFENYPETEHFYPKYVACLGSHRVGIQNPLSGDGVPSDLRTCVRQISDQCEPLPCYKEGYMRCIDGQASFTCVCKPGWRGARCEEDIDECSDLEVPAGCDQKCFNFPGSFRCMCEDGYFSRDRIHCTDINECLLYPSICGPATCFNTLGMYECQCPPGYKYNFTARACQDVDECKQDACEGECVNTMGSFSCHCDGRQGLKLVDDGRFCEEIPVCVYLHDIKDAEMLYLGEQFAGLSVIYLRFRLPENTKFAAEFDFRTFDPEGVILYAESSPDSWFMLGLRAGRIEVQFKNQHSVKVTSGGKVINDGEWHVISVDELERSISVKISKEARHQADQPQAGRLHPRVESYEPGGRQGSKRSSRRRRASTASSTWSPGSYFPGEGLARFHVNYSVADNDTVPLSVSVLTRGQEEADLQVFIGEVPVATLQSVMLCYPERLFLELSVSETSVQITANSSTILYADPDILQSRLSALNTSMQGAVETFIGGVPELPVTATPVTAFYHGCMEITINGKRLDFDEALSKHNSIKSHSCPPVSQTGDSPFPLQ